MKQQIAQIRACTVCQAFLPFPPRPIFQVTADAKILIIGQAPGLKAQRSGIPWHDQSGHTLRRWLGVTSDDFYHSGLFALMPMGFCFPGAGPSGDRPPRSECAPLWHDLIRAEMPNIKLTILIGQYAQRYYLKPSAGTSLTKTVRSFQQYLPSTYHWCIHRRGI